MRFSVLALASAFGIGIPANTSSVKASKETETTATTKRQKLQHHRQTQVEKKVTRKFHSLPEKSRSAAKSLFQLKKQRTADFSPIRNFELCELSSRTITPTTSSRIHPTDNNNLDIGILGGNGCSSEKDICILPNLVGFQDTSSSEPIETFQDGQFRVNLDLDEQIYHKIAMGICYPVAAMDEFYLAAVTTKTEIRSSNSNSNVENENHDTDNHTQAPTDNDTFGYRSYYHSSHSNYDLVNTTVRDMDDAPANLIDDYYLPTYESHNGNDKNRDLSNVDAKAATKILRMSQIGEDISHNALTLRDSHYLDCMNYCSEFDRPKIAEWLATQTPSGPWPMLEELIAICMDAYHYIHNLGFTGIPHFCPFDPMIPLNCWDMSGVTTLETAFRKQKWFNQPLNCWDTSSVTSTAGMFEKAYAFNQNIGLWNTSLVEDMTEMFLFAVNFDQPLGHWETGRVTDISRMFFGANRFNSHIDSWNVESVQSMDETFFAAQNFNQPLGSWNTSSLTRLNNTFVASFSFNQPIGSWDVSGVTSLRSTFMNALSFNQPLNTWDVSNVVDMDYTFLSATRFNQSLDIGSDGDSYWNIQSARSMKQMFCRTSFDQCISTWPNHISNQYGVNETATFGMFFEAECPVELEMGTPLLDKGPWCQGKSQGCHKAKNSKKGSLGDRLSRKSVKSSKSSKSSKYSDRIH